MPALFDPDSPGAAALRSTIASTLASRLGEGSFDPDVLPQYAVVLLSSGTSRDDVASAIGEFLEAGVARDFAAWLFDHVQAHARDYGFSVDGNAAAGGGTGGGGEAMADDVEKDAAAADDAERARSGADAGGRGGGPSSFSRGRGARGRGGRGRVGLGVSRGRGGRGFVSKATAPSRSVFDRLGTAADVAAGAAAAGASTGNDKPSIGDPARLRALRQELVRLRDAAASASGSAAGASSNASGAAAAAGRTVLVKNVHFDADDAALREHFSSAGLVVERATVARSGAGRGPSKGYGIVAFASVEAAKRALALAGSTLEGREIDVVPALPTGIALEEGVLAPRGTGARGGRGRGRGRFSRGGGRGGFSSFDRRPRSTSYASPELAARRSAEAAAAKRAALDAELDAMCSGKQ